MTYLLILNQVIKDDALNTHDRVESTRHERFQILRLLVSTSLIQHAIYEFIFDVTMSYRLFVYLIKDCACISYRRPQFISVLLVPFHYLAMSLNCAFVQVTMLLYHKKSVCDEKLNVSLRFFCTHLVE